MGIEPLSQPHLGEFKNISRHPTFQPANVFSNIIEEMVVNEGRVAVESADYDY